MDVTGERPQLISPPTPCCTHEDWLRGCGCPHDGENSRTDTGMKLPCVSFQAETRIASIGSDDFTDSDTIAGPDHQSASSDCSSDETQTDFSFMIDYSSCTSSEDECGEHPYQTTRDAKLSQQQCGPGEHSRQYPHAKAQAHEASWNSTSFASSSSNFALHSPNACINPVLLNLSSAGIGHIHHEQCIPPNPHKRRRAPECHDGETITKPGDTAIHVSLLTAEDLLQLESIQTDNVSKLKGICAELSTPLDAQTEKLFLALRKLVSDYIRNSAECCHDHLSVEWTAPSPVKCLVPFSGRPLPPNPHDRKKRYVCVSGCGQTFKQKNDWVRHLALNWLRGYWQCPCCDEQFESKRPEKLYGPKTGHLSTHHSRIEKRNRERDYRPHALDENFRKQCGFCGTACSSFDIFTSHVEKHFKAGYGMDAWRYPWYETATASTGGDDDDDGDQDGDEDEDRGSKDNNGSDQQEETRNGDGGGSFSGGNSDGFNSSGSDHGDGAQDGGSDQDHWSGYPPMDSDFMEVADTTSANQGLPSAESQQHIRARLRQDSVVDRAMVALPGLPLRPKRSAEDDHLPVCHPLSAPVDHVSRPDLEFGLEIPFRPFHSRVSFESGRHLDSRVWDMRHPNIERLQPAIRGSSGFASQTLPRTSQDIAPPPLEHNYISGALPPMDYGNVNPMQQEFRDQFPVDARRSRQMDRDELPSRLSSMGLGGDHYEEGKSSRKRSVSRSSILRRSTNTSILEPVGYELWRFEKDGDEWTHAVQKQLPASQKDLAKKAKSKSKNGTVLEQIQRMGKNRLGQVDELVKKKSRQTGLRWEPAWIEGFKAGISRNNKKDVPIFDVIVACAGLNWARWSLSKGWTNSVSIRGGERVVLKDRTSSKDNDDGEKKDKGDKQGGFGKQSGGKNKEVVDPDSFGISKLSARSGKPFEHGGGVPFDELHLPPHIKEDEPIGRMVQKKRGGGGSGKSHHGEHADEIVEVLVLSNPRPFVIERRNTASESYKLSDADQELVGNIIDEKAWDEYVRSKAKETRGPTRSALSQILHLYRPMWQFATMIQEVELGLEDMAGDVDVNPIWSMAYLNVMLSLDSVSNSVSKLKKTASWMTDLRRQIELLLSFLDQAGNDGKTMRIEMSQVFLGMMHDSIIYLQRFPSDDEFMQTYYSNMQPKLKGYLAEMEDTVKHISAMVTSRRINQLQESRLGEVGIGEREYPVDGAENAIFPVDNMPQHKTRHFAGRGAEIDRIHNWLGGQENTRLKTYLIYGRRGIGKTQIALEYFERHRSDFDAVFWIACETGASLRQSFAEIATALELDGADKNGHFEENLMKVLRWLRHTRKRWLLIYDNAERENLLKDFWPAGTRGSILLTSRTYYNFFEDDQRQGETVPLFSEMPQRRYNIDHAHPNTCQWISDHATYQSWQAQSSGLLWIQGKPGAGKSTLMSFIYDAMMNEPGTTLSTRLDFFFNGRGAPLQKSFLGMLQAVLNQLYTQCPTIRGPLRKVFEDKQTAFGSGGHQWEWQRQELERLFLLAAMEAAQSRSLLIFVDALDEAGEHAAREIAAYFHKLNNVRLNTPSRLRICISCRHYPVTSTIPGSEIWVESFNGNDIISFIQDEIRIEHLAREGSAERLAWQGLMEELTQRAAGVFQWTRLVVPMAVKYISDGKSPAQIRRRFRNVPDKLSDVYEHILEHVMDPDNRPRTLLLLQWVCLARQRPSFNMPFAKGAGKGLGALYRPRASQMVRISNAYRAGEKYAVFV